MKTIVVEIFWGPFSFNIILIEFEPNPQISIATNKRFIFFSLSLTKNIEGDRTKLRCDFFLNHIFSDTDLD